MRSSKISIVIPVFNEADGLRAFLSNLGRRTYDPGRCEIILVDGGSTDETVHIAKKSGFEVLNSGKGRAIQMNTGARKATGEILYFLHADTLPPQYFDRILRDAIHAGTPAGCFRMNFDSNNLLLRICSWFTRFNCLLCRGGDQSLFLRASTFRKLGGFNEDFIIYEDCEFISRLYRQAAFKVLPHSVVSSARKYRSLGTVYLQFHFGMIHLMNFLGLGPDQLHRYYEKRISARLS